MENVPKALTIQEVAERYGVNKTTIYRAITEGKLPALEVKRQVYIDPRSLEIWQPRAYAGRPRKQKGGEE